MVRLQCLDPWLRSTVHPIFNIGWTLGHSRPFLTRIDCKQTHEGCWNKEAKLSLLRMLDNLALPDSSPLKLTAQSWLLHTLMRGDVPHLLDPLLLPLLAPTTARVSVLSIQHRSTVLPNEADRAESRIYAISSEDGNVIYHVTPVQSSDQKQSDSVRARRIFTVATLVRHCTYERDVSFKSYVLGNTICSYWKLHRDQQ